jgi:ubiquinone biosynthesis monooxygenase Coq7
MGAINRDCLNMLEVERIMRVDHAGEFGAIQIYRAQRLVAKLFYRDIVAQLDVMLEHEQAHFGLFDGWLKTNKVRHCYALWFWAAGGFMLGLFTALLGRKAIWVCTDAIESTVLHHLVGQLDFLQQHDTAAYQAVLSIKTDEEDHQQHGATHGSKSWIYWPIHWVVKSTTTTAIWLSTKL